MTEYKVSTEKPLIYDKLKEKFGVNWNDGIIIADGDTIHCMYEIPPEKTVHELVHLRQQEKIGKDLWWELYLNDKNFRFQQESEAYFKEAKFLKDNIKDRNFVFKMLWQLCENMSSHQYGNMCTFEEAKTIIL